VTESSDLPSFSGTVTKNNERRSEGGPVGSEHDLKVNMSFLFTLFRPVFRTPHVLDVWNLKFCQHSDLGTLLLNYVPHHSICISPFYMRRRGR